MKRLEVTTYLGAKYLFFCLLFRSTPLAPMVHGLAGSIITEGFVQACFQLDLIRTKDPCRALIRTEGFIPDPYHLDLIRTKDPCRALIRTEGFILAPFSIGSYQN